jgi:hypothetical protein
VSTLILVEGTLNSLRFLETDISRLYDENKFELSLMKNRIRYDFKLNSTTKL